MKVIHNISLVNFTSLHAGGKARTLIELEKNDDLSEVLRRQKDQVWVLGYGTNCLVSDQGLSGTVIVNKSGGIHKISPTRFKVSSGVNWDSFIKRVVRDELWGLEFTSGIPGGTGAAVAGNIAAYGHKVADCFVEATIFDHHKNKTEIWAKDELGFDYRQSYLQSPMNSHLVVLDATFEFSHQPTADLKYEFAIQTAEDLGLDPDTLQHRRQIILEARRRSGSILTDIKKGPWTAGSFFKNPIVSVELAEEIIKFEERPRTRDQLLKQMLIHGENKSRVSAAHVLLAAGFRRGQTWGNVRLHPEHILKIENTGQATATEIYDVVQEILATVRQKLGIELVPEVRFLGKF